MSDDDLLLNRIRGEYEEMPGLRLTVAQACRLWQLDHTMCVTLVERLVVERFLYRTHDGAFAAFPTGRPRPAQATLPETLPAGLRVRRPA